MVLIEEISINTIFYLKKIFELFWKSLLKYYSDLCQLNYYCQSFKCKFSSKEKVSKQMFTALKTLKKYMKYIENMFKSNITNGLIEGLNNKIKSIKRTAFGYSNFSNFKKRILIQAGIISISA